jgi:hypothetical protein
VAKGKGLPPPGATPITGHIMELWSFKNYSFYSFDLFLNHAVKIVRLKINLRRIKWCKKCLLLQSLFTFLASAFPGSFEGVRI